MSVQVKVTAVLIWLPISIVLSVCGDQAELGAQQSEVDVDAKIRVSCDSNATIESRSMALKAIASQNDWQGLARVLIWVTKEHNKVLRVRYAENEKDFVQNVNGIQHLPIPEDFIIKELVRINNPGAIPYLRKYRTERYSLPVTDLGGETLAALEASIEKLEATLIHWSPDKSDKSTSSELDEKSDR